MCNLVVISSVSVAVSVGLLHHSVYCLAAGESAAVDFGAGLIPD